MAFFTPSVSCLIGAVKAMVSRSAVAIAPVIVFTVLMALRAVVAFRLAAILTQCAFRILIRAFFANCIRLLETLVAFVTVIALIPATILTH